MRELAGRTAFVTHPELRSMVAPRFAAVLDAVDRTDVATPSEVDASE